MKMLSALTLELVQHGIASLHLCRKGMPRGTTCHAGPSPAWSCLVSPQSAARGLMAAEPGTTGLNNVSAWSPTPCAILYAQMTRKGSKLAKPCVSKCDRCPGNLLEACLRFGFAQAAFPPKMESPLTLRSWRNEPISASSLSCCEAAIL